MGPRAHVVEPTPNELALLAARKEREKEKAAEREALTQERRLQAQRLLEVSPPSDDPCDLVLRLPNGRRAARRFKSNATLSDVYSWATCSGELSGLQGGDCFEVPRSFTLATTYPRAVLRNPEDG